MDGRAEASRTYIRLPGIMLYVLRTLLLGRFPSLALVCMLDGASAFAAVLYVRSSTRKSLAAPPP